MSMNKTLLAAAITGLLVAGNAGAVVLGIGTIELEDGSSVKSFLCEEWAVRGAQDITGFGGWKAYCNALTMGKAGVASAG